jgi:hypothetical protein
MESAGRWHKNLFSQEFSRKFNFLSQRVSLKSGEDGLLHRHLPTVRRRFVSFTYALSFSFL